MHHLQNNARRSWRLVGPGRFGLGARRAVAIVGVAAVGVMSVPVGAHADSIQNVISPSGSDTVLVGEVARIGYTIQAPTAANPNDPQAGCNASDGTPMTLTVHAPAAVTVTPQSQTFTQCRDPQYFEFSSATAGSYSVTVSAADANTVGLYDVSKAGFTLTVNKPLVTNTPPTISVTGVANGASYEFGNVPTVGCAVTDKEDGPSNPAPALSEISGPRAGDGLGSRTATCTYTDAGTLTASAAATFNIVDTTKPLVTATAPAAVEATGARTPVTFATSANDNVDGARAVTCKTPGDTVYASGDGFPVGTTSLTCSATDKAGNVGTAEPIDVVVTDTTAPSITTPANMVVPNDNGPAATVDYSDATAVDLVDGSVPVSCTPASGTEFALGETTVTCTASDTAGNQGSETFTVEVQDKTAPVVNVPADITAEATSADGATVKYPTVTASDDVDGELSPTCDWASDSVFPLGDTTVTCSATDTAGNAADNTFVVTVEDTTAPHVNVPADIVKEATSPAGAAVEFDVTATDAVDGSVVATCSADSGSTFALGETTVLCSADDSAHNTGSATFVVKVEDTTAPDLQVSGDVTAEATGANGAKVSYDTASADDIVDGPIAPACAPASDTQFGLGVTTVTCTARDNAGNESSKSFSVTVEDTTAPVVNVPANLVVGNTSSTGASGVTYTGESATDLVSGSLPVHCTPPSGSDFPLGVTTVTCSATDDAGNEGKNSFTVEVQDQTKPEVQVVADMTEEATGPTGATVTWFGVTASDDVDGALDATCNPASGSVFPIGTTTVTCSAQDKAGNVGDNSFDVTVADTTAPNLTVSGNKTAVATSAAGASVTYTAPTASDIVDGAVAASCDKASGSIFRLGVTTVVCTATDEAGNTGSESFTVNVGAAWSNVLQPINVDGTSVFKLGSTVPVKFQLTGASAGIKDLVARLYYKRVESGVAGKELEAVSTSNATSGNLFRYDATSAQYIFNLGTKTLNTGAYQLRIDLGDGQLHTVNITLR